jgi:hypothetical protein
MLLTAIGYGQPVEAAPRTNGILDNLSGTTLLLPIGDDCGIVAKTQRRIEGARYRLPFLPALTCAELRAPSERTAQS